MSIRIVNIVATADLGQPVDLKEVARIHHTIHGPEIYGGRVAYLKTPTMHGKTTIFTSGKLISVGTTSRQDAELDVVLLAEVADVEAVEDGVRAGVARHGGVLTNDGLGA